MDNDRASVLSDRPRPDGWTYYGEKHPSED